MVNWGDNHRPLTNTTERSTKKRRHSYELNYNPAHVATICDQLTLAKRKMDAQAYLLTFNDLPAYSIELKTISHNLDDFTTRLHQALITYGKK